MDKESYAEMWHRWIFEDYYRTYMLPLEKYGIKIHHDDVHEAWNRITKKNYVHKVAQFFTVGWPLNFWRIEAQTDKDFSGSSISIRAGLLNSVTSGNGTPS